MEQREEQKPLNEPKPSGGKRMMGPAAWTLLVTAGSAAVGLALAIVIQGPTSGSPWHPGPGQDHHFDSFEGIDTVLSTTAIGLMSALLVVYVKTYEQTKAKFALGLVMVLSALLVQGLLSSPLLFGAFGHSMGLLGPFLMIADGFKLVAFTVFLYLSLQ